jgi:hypothetical protein
MSRAAVAQWIERFPPEEEVGGSNPPSRAIFLWLVDRGLGAIRSWPLSHKPLNRPDKEVRVLGRIESPGQAIHMIRSRGGNDHLPVEASDPRNALGDIPQEVHFFVGNRFGAMVADVLLQVFFDPQGIWR